MGMRLGDNGNEVVGMGGNGNPDILLAPHLDLPCTPLPNEAPSVRTAHIYVHIIVHSGGARTAQNRAVLIVFRRVLHILSYKIIGTTLFIYGRPM